MAVNTTSDLSWKEKISSFIKGSVRNLLIMLNLEFLLNKLRRINGTNVSILPLQKQDIDYLINLINNLDIPPQINKDKFYTELNKSDKSHKGISYFLIPIANFILWYNFFYLGKNLMLSKSSSL
jgi:hypothetical protein